MIKQEGSENDNKGSDQEEIRDLEGLTYDGYELERLKYELEGLDHNMSQKKQKSVTTWQTQKQQVHSI